MTNLVFNRLVPIALVTLTLGLGFAALDQYNVTWDEALGDFFFGQRYLAYFSSFDSTYLDFESNPFPPGHQPNLEFSPFRGRPWEYSPVANTLAAATSLILSNHLAVIDPFDGFHAFNLLLAAGFLWLFYRFLTRYCDSRTALLACLFLMSSPRVVFHMLANIKDFPHMILFATTVIVWFHWAYCRSSLRGLVVAGLLWGLALGTRPNALFLPLIPLAVASIGRRPAVVEWRGKPISHFWPSVGAGLVALSTWFLSWPYLWPDPVARLTLHFSFLLGRSAHTRSESLAPVVESLTLTTPVPLLAFALVGSIVALRRVRRRDPLSLLLCAWCAAVLCRFAIPGMVNYDGVRHLLELVPAMCALAGLGCATLSRALEGLLPVGRYRTLVAVTVAAAAILPGATAVARTHPFQSAYWNVFAGGLSGARAASLPQAGDYWGSSYRQGLEWLDKNAPEGAFLVVPVIEHAVRLVAHDRLRPDLTLLPVTTPLTPHIDPDRLAKTRELARRDPVYVMFVVRKDWTNQIMVDCLENLQPIAEWKLDGEPILLIYEYRVNEIRTRRTPAHR